MQKDMYNAYAKLFSRVQSLTNRWNLYGSRMLLMVIILISTMGCARNPCGSVNSTVTEKTNKVYITGKNTLGGYNIAMNIPPDYAIRGGFGQDSYHWEIKRVSSRASIGVSVARHEKMPADKKNCKVIDDCIAGIPVIWTREVRGVGSSNVNYQMTLLEGVLSSMPANSHWRRCEIGITIEWDNNVEYDNLLSIVKTISVESPGEGRRYEHIVTMSDNVSNRALTIDVPAGYAAYNRIGDNGGKVTEVEGWDDGKMYIYVSSVNECENGLYEKVTEVVIAGENVRWGKKCEGMNTKECTEEVCMKGLLDGNKVSSGSKEAIVQIVIEPSVDGGFDKMRKCAETIKVEK